MRIFLNRVSSSVCGSNSGSLLQPPWFVEWPCQGTRHRVTVILGFSQLLRVMSQSPPWQLLPPLLPLSSQTAQISQVPVDLYVPGSRFPLFPQPIGPVALLHLPTVILSSLLPSEVGLPWLPPHVRVTRVIGCGHWSSGKLPGTALHG